MVGPPAIALGTRGQQRRGPCHAAIFLSIPRCSVITITRVRAPPLNYLVGRGLQRFRGGEAEAFGGPQFPNKRTPARRAADGSMLSKNSLISGVGGLRDR
jgi:hypothetical protein